MLLLRTPFRFVYKVRVSFARLASWDMSLMEFLRTFIYDFVRMLENARAILLCDLRAVTCDGILYFRMYRGPPMLLVAVAYVFLHVRRRLSLPWRYRQKQKFSLRKSRRYPRIEEGKVCSLPRHEAVRNRPTLLGVTSKNPYADCRMCIFVR